MPEAFDLGVGVEDPRLAKNVNSTRGSSFREPRLRRTLGEQEVDGEERPPEPKPEVGNLRAGDLDEAGQRIHELHLARGGAADTQ